MKRFDDTLKELDVTLLLFKIGDLNNLMNRI